MADALALTRPRGFSLTQLSGPVVILLVLVMLAVPLPPPAISFLFALNISAGLVILGASLYIPSPAEFSSFPSVLLATTLMRLALNVATARAILLNGYSGPGAAGHVIEAFGQFAVGGNYVVGGIIFIILIVINFVVVTKGASRVAEVSARFMLDSLPGRQMAIDAEINAGILSPQAAERRRDGLRREADFFGAMDGASKFVRGDVVAAMVILVVNMLGGLIIGTLQYGLPLSDAARTYTLLTVGDGLAAQIPSLTISVAAGLVVTRVATGEDIGAQIKSQLSKYPQALAIAAAITVAIGLVPEMAHIPFLMLGGALGVAAWRLSRANPEQEQAKAQQQGEAEGVKPEVKADTLTDVSGVDPLGMNIGFALAPMVGPGEGRLLGRMTAVRQRYGRAMGFLVPAVHIRDSSDLPAHGYRFMLRGAAIEGGEAWPGQWLAIEGPMVVDKLTIGRPVKDPAFGQNAVWIPQGTIPAAEELGYTVVDAATAIATHFAEVLKRHGAELLGRPQVEGLLTRLAETTPRLAEDLRASLSAGVIRQVCQGLLAEEVPVRDFERIAEALVEAADGGLKDPEKLLVAVRLRLGRFIVSQFTGSEPGLRVAVLPPKLEELVGKSLRSNREGAPAEIEAEAATHLRQAADHAAKTMRARGMKPVLVVQAAMRRAVAKCVQGVIQVIALEEIPETTPLQVVQASDPVPANG
ncbi:flagellar biosynthesis protein FlhA [Acidocella aminolytica]|jgi:flagellar biosynthesis protein FlhA|uniref:Flagellar biosynthesis protein FlhA n=1 Tax=Acidocella aminolytica 101 = DSM 11237 TaxID=1120923 RepID=A0A0D6PFR0_9PROT|nr:flagellar biosynthesis protein FlhA [Acidocella aminolytica]GAN80053.1 flagellar biosynthesis protein FlhA [Acidocella aminolytica 101 = DSM 11237]GBQ40642.1 flagellar biosynthesis protein FlhA [Acidocella aminolytica 101 = DSM 11237]SHF07801.1 flagellar biosynthesis protein FlhA [Acidocella aminolytica 101 = DSM 11237]